MRRFADILPLIALALAFFVLFACMLEQQFEVRRSYCASYEKSATHLDQLLESCKTMFSPPGMLHVPSQGFRHASL